MTPRIVFEGNKVKRSSENSAGWDIRSNELSTIINPGERHAFQTNVYMVECDERLYLRVAPRSGLASRHGVDVLAGVIDSDYRGEIKVILINHSDSPLQIDKG